MNVKTQTFEAKEQGQMFSACFCCNRARKTSIFFKRQKPVNKHLSAFNVLIHWVIYFHFVSWLVSSFVGCYNYSAEDKMNFGGYLPNLTRETCLEKCQSFSLFGLTGGDRCYCRSHLPNSSSVDRQFCRELPCQGEETCGAEQYVAIWDYSVEVEDNTGNHSIHKIFILSFQGMAETYNVHCSCNDGQPIYPLRCKP